MNLSDNVNDVEAAYEPTNPAIPLIVSEINKKESHLADRKEELNKLEQQREQLLASIENLKNVEITKIQDTLHDLKQSTVLLLEKSIIKNENYEKLLESFLLDDNKFIDLLASKFEFTQEEEQQLLDKNLSEALLYKAKAVFLNRRAIQEIDPDGLFDKNGNNRVVINFIHGRLCKLADYRYNA